MDAEALDIAQPWLQKDISFIVFFLILQKISI
jgi:hypothetical protein